MLYPELEYIFNEMEFVWKQLNKQRTIRYTQKTVQSELSFIVDVIAQ